MILSSRVPTAHKRPLLSAAGTSSQPVAHHGEKPFITHGSNPLPAQILAGCSPFACRGVRNTPQYFHPWKRKLQGTAARYLSTGSRLSCNLIRRTFTRKTFEFGVWPSCSHLKLSKKKELSQYRCTRLQRRWNNCLRIGYTRVNERLRDVGLRNRQCFIQILHGDFRQR